MFHEQLQIGLNLYPFHFRLRSQILLMLSLVSIVPSLLLSQKVENLTVWNLGRRIFRMQPALDF